MPNWCNTTYFFQFKKEKNARKFEKFLERATTRKTPGQDFGGKWLGNLLIEAGDSFTLEHDETFNEGRIVMPEHGFRYRGTLPSFCLSDKDEVTVDTETVWQAMPGALKYALDSLGLKNGENYTVTYYAEEPGNEYFVADSKDSVGGDMVAILELPQKFRDRLNDFGYDEDTEVVYNEPFNGEPILAYYYIDAKDLRKCLGKLIGESGTLDELVQKAEKKYPGTTLELANVQFCDWTDLI